MPISINGTGTITGISAGGLPDDSITTAEIAGSAVTTAKLAQPLTLATAQASTSGTAIDFTGIPSWARRITVMLEGVSTSGASICQIQLGSTTFSTSGYLGVYSAWSNASSPVVVSISSGFGIFTDNAANVRHGSIQLNWVSANKWTCSGVICFSSTAIQATMAGSISLGGILDRVRITTVNGTDTFDAGSINIMYEG